MYSRLAGRFAWSAILCTSALLTLTAPAMAISGGHSTGRAIVAQVAWGSVDPETFTGDWGLVAAFDQDGSTGIVLHEEDSVPITCAGGYPGSQGTFRHGQGPADTLSIAPNLGSAAAGGTLLVISGTFNTCTQSFEMTGEETVTIALTLSASGRRDTTVDRYADAVPGEYRFTSINRTASRPAIGSLTIDGSPVAYAAALISSHSFSEQFVSH
jgi:hypothetical protein